jgi:hypothetical protein
VTRERRMPASIERRCVQGHGGSPPAPCILRRNQPLAPAEQTGPRSEWRRGDDRGGGGGSSLSPPQPVRRLVGLGARPRAVSHGSRQVVLANDAAVITASRFTASSPSERDRVLRVDLVHGRRRPAVAFRAGTGASIGSSFAASLAFCDVANAANRAERDESQRAFERHALAARFMCAPGRLRRRVLPRPSGRRRS